MGWYRCYRLLMTPPIRAATFRKRSKSFRTPFNPTSLRGSSSTSPASPAAVRRPAAAQPATTKTGSARRRLVPRRPRPAESAPPEFAETRTPRVALAAAPSDSGWSRAGRSVIQRLHGDPRLHPASSASLPGRKSRRRNRFSPSLPKRTSLHQKLLAVHRAGALIHAIQAGAQPLEIRRDFAVDHGLDRAGGRDRALRR